MPYANYSIANAPLKRSSGLSIVLAVLLIIFGCLAILLPIEMSMGVVIVICWLLMISGVVQVVDAFRGTRGWHSVWKVAVAVAYFLTGLYLRLNVGIGLVALTLALIMFFLFQGVLDFIIYFRTRRIGGSAWLLLHGIASFILGLMIWRHWPSGSLGVVGFIVGINMILTGTTRLMLALAARRADNLIAQEAS